MTKDKSNNEFNTITISVDNIQQESKVARMMTANNTNNIKTDDNKIIKKHTFVEPGIPDNENLEEETWNKTKPLTSTYQKYTFLKNHKFQKPKENKLDNSNSFRAPEVAAISENSSPAVNNKKTAILQHTNMK